MVGNTPNFNSLDVFRCFLLLENKTSRATLVKSLELGEGTVRSVLDVLKNKGLTSSTRKGHFLNDDGKALISKVHGIIGILQDINYSRFYPEKKKSVIVVKNIDKKIEINAGLRDVSLKSGGDGALIFQFDEKLVLPQVEDEFPELEKLLEISNGQFLVLGFGMNSRYASNGALGVALEMNKKLKEVFSKIC